MKIKKILNKLENFKEKTIETSIKTIYSISPWYIDVLNKILGVTPKRVLSVGEKNPTYESESKGFTILDYDDYEAAGSSHCSAPIVSSVLA